MSVLFKLLANVSRVDYSFNSLTRIFPLYRNLESDKDQQQVHCEGRLQSPRIVMN